MTERNHEAVPCYINIKYLTTLGFLGVKEYLWFIL